MAAAKYVLTGPMRSGKSSIIQNLIRKYPNICTIGESAREIIEKEENSEKLKEEQIVPYNPSKYYEFHEILYNFENKRERETEKFSKESKIILKDRCKIDMLAYLKLGTYLEYGEYENSELYNKLSEDIRKMKKFECVFMCEAIDNTMTKESREDIQHSKKLEELLWETYKIFGYSPVVVPRFYEPDSAVGLSEAEKKDVKDRAIERRVKFILSYIP